MDTLNPAIDIYLWQRSGAEHFDAGHVDCEEEGIGSLRGNRGEQEEIHGPQVRPHRRARDRRFSRGFAARPAQVGAAALAGLDAAPESATSRRHQARQHAGAARRKGRRRRGSWQRSPDRRQLEGINPVRLQAEGTPDPLNAGVETPEACAIRRELQCVASAGRLSRVRTITGSIRVS